MLSHIKRHLCLTIWVQNATIILITVTITKILANAIVLLLLIPTVNRGASCSWWWSEGGPWSHQSLSSSSQSHQSLSSSSWSHQSLSSSSRSHSLHFPHLCVAFDSPSLPILSNKRYHPRSKIRSSSIPILPSQKWAFQGKILSLPTISLFNSRWKTIQAIQKYVHLFGWTQLF